MLLVLLVLLAMLAMLVVAKSRGEQSQTELAAWTRTPARLRAVEKGSRFLAFSKDPESI